MNYFGKSALACLMLLLAGNCLNACELPAHPSASAMPVNITTKDGTKMTIKKALEKGIVGLVQGKNNGQFHYLIPEGSNVELKIVWDPVCHNSDSVSSKAEEYEYIVDGHNEGNRINIDEEIGIVGGYGFFPLSAMTDFFSLNGNRKDVKEAFTREKGIKETDEIIKGGLGGPQTTLTMFTVKGEQLELHITSAKAKDSGYTDEPRVPADTKSNPLKEMEGINTKIPGEHWNFKLGDGITPYIYDSSTEKAKENKSFLAYKVNDSEDDLIVYSENSGLLMKDIDYGLEKPDPSKYIAYIVENDNKEKIHVSGINYDKNASDAANGGTDGKFNVTFTTPSIAGCLSDGTEADAAIKIMVNSPPAGYKLSNLFWVWEEQDYKRKTSGEVDVEGLGKIKLQDDENKNVYVYEKSGKSRKCSCGLVIVIDKPQDGIGYAAYKVYDNCGPISTTMKLTEKVTFAEEDGKTDKDSLSSTFKYEINILDSNPFIDKNVVAQKDDKGNIIEKTPSGDISQNTDKMEVTFYYNYPIYNYEPKEISSIEDFKGNGLLDFAKGNESGHDPKFKTYTHNTSWYWKKAVDVKVDPVKVLSKITGDDGRLIGSISSISGSFTIDNPKPWHASDKYPEVEPGKEINKNLSVFAVLKDPAGNTHVIDLFKKEKDQTNTPLESANPKNFYKGSYAVNPIENSADELLGNTDKGSNTSPYWLDDLEIQGKKFDSTWDTSAWQPLTFLKSDDKTSPEIQVIVLDTRTNRYHIFGTKENVAAGLNNFSSTTHKTYVGLEKVPYIGRNTAISQSYSYTGFVNVNSLYDTYLRGDSDGNAVSTVNDPLNRNGFVCQKGTRLIFYAHAFDNVAYDSSEKFGGLQPSTFKYTFIDNNGKEIVKDESGDKPLEYVFRQENFDKNGNLKQGDSAYKLLVQAEDLSGNKREFELDIGVLGRTLDIRTLEEKRERVE